MLQFHILTIFPNMFDSYMNESILKRAQKNKYISVTAHDIRAFATDKHSMVDDSPYGGGPGMVMKVEPIYKAVEQLKKKGKRKRVILFSTRGKKLDAHVAKRLAKYDSLILICGRYEGVDERVATHIADEEISVGDFVLSGGELPAMMLVDAVARFVPGVLGKKESLEEIKGSYPVYTKPEVFQPKKKGKKWVVPKVLVSGNHKKIEEWRKQGK